MAHTSQKDLRLKLQNYTDTTKAYTSHRQPANMHKAQEVTLNSLNDTRIKNINLNGE